MCGLQLVLLKLKRERPPNNVRFSIQYTLTGPWLLLFCYVRKTTPKAYCYELRCTGEVLFFCTEYFTQMHHNRHSFGKDDFLIHSLTRVLSSRQPFRRLFFSLF